MGKTYCWTGVSLYSRQTRLLVVGLPSGTILQTDRPDPARRGRALNALVPPRRSVFAFSITDKLKRLAFWAIARCGVTTGDGRGRLSRLPRDAAAPADNLLP